MKKLLSSVMALSLVMASLSYLASAGDIKRCQTPPTIDGILTPGEWDEYFWFSDSDDPPMEGYITNDDENLYLAFKVTDTTPLGTRDIFYVYVDIPPVSVFNEPADAFGFGWVYTTTWTTAYTWFEKSTDAYPFNVTRKVGTMPDGVEIVANMATDARYYEMKIPLSVISASPGDVIGLKIFARNTGPGTPRTDTINWYPNLPEGITSVYPEARVNVEGNYEHMTLALGVVYYHDIAITELTVTPTMVEIGDTVEIRVTVKNVGNATETFTLITNYGVYKQVETIKDLPPGDELTFSYEWDTTGEHPCIHDISALAIPVPGETIISNNYRTTGVRIVSYIPEPALVAVEPNYKKGVAGGFLDVDVVISNLDAYWDLAAFDIKLRYNTTMLDVVTIELGEFAKRFNLTWQLFKEINEEEGYVHLAYIWDFIALPPEMRPTPYGQGILFTVRFALKETGTSALELANVDLAAFPNATKWCAEWTEAIHVTVQNGLVEVIPRHIADLNSDGKVNIYDVVIAVRAYASKPGDPNWNPNADLAAPFGIINIYDIVTLVKYYGLVYDP